MIEVRNKSAIQIDITNSCRFSCTNCYRFIGHYVEPQFMELAKVKRAIDSLEGYGGIIGITGGEPTMHPDFEEICNYLRKKVPLVQRSLQTTGYKWSDYKSVIKNTFAGRVRVNDHKDKTQRHHPMLVAIKDVVVDPSLRRELIDKCWVNEKWSAVINSKGCFSCELAGALDSLFNGPGGYPIEKGWWAKDYEHFNSQMERYCCQCGAALPQPPVTMENGKDHVSISNYRELEKIGSPKFKNGQVLLIETKYSTQDLGKIKETWEPWKHWGGKGRGKNILQRYGIMNSIFLSHKIILQHVIYKPKTVERSDNGDRSNPNKQVLLRT